MATTVPLKRKRRKSWKRRKKKKRRRWTKAEKKSPLKAPKQTFLARENFPRIQSE
jgi:hypothetical protein